MGEALDALFLLAVFAGLLGGAFAEKEAWLRSQSATDKEPDQ